MVRVDLELKSGESSNEKLAYLTFYEEGRGWASVVFDNKAGVFGKLLAELEADLTADYNLRGFVIPADQRRQVADSLLLFALELPLAEGFQAKTY